MWWIIVVPIAILFIFAYCMSCAAGRADERADHIYANWLIKQHK